jgi:hypothetical protein
LVAATIPDVNADGLRTARSFKLLLPQSAQELGLQFDGQVADLIKKKRAFAGKLEASDALRQSAGERPPLMTE